MKKLLAMILTISMVLSMFAVPTSASSDGDIASHLVFDANYTTGSLADQANNTPYWDMASNNPILGEDFVGTPITFAQDETIGLTVAQIRSAGVVYDVPAEYMGNNFTCEMYVKVNGSNWGMLAGTYYTNHREYTGWGFQYHFFGAANGDPELGKANNVTIFDTYGGYVQSSEGVVAGGKIRGKWSHLVYVNRSSQYDFYVNGNLVSTKDTLASAVPYTRFALTPDKYLNTSNCAGFRVGGFRPQTDQMCLSMDVAYVRLFDTPATAAEVTALYNARNTGSVPAISDVPQGEPSRLIFDLDPSTGTMEDQSGFYTFSNFESNDFEFDYDADIDRDVVYFDGYAGAKYYGGQFHLYDFKNGLTYEMYFKLDDVHKNQALMGQGLSQVSLMGYDSGEDHLLAFATDDRNTDQPLAIGANRIGVNESLPVDEWTHIIATVDGDSQELYVNGVLAAEGPRNFEFVPSIGDFLILGDSAYGMMWGDFVFTGYMASAKVYTKHVDAAQAAELYVETTGNSVGEHTPKPEPTPPVQDYYDGLLHVEYGTVWGEVGLSGDIVIPDGVTTIDFAGFSNCNQITSISIPSSVVNIEESAFHYCSGLTAIAIPSTVENIGESVFFGCTNLTTICCEADSKPAGWSAEWNAGCDATVLWGVLPTPAPTPSPVPTPPPTPTPSPVPTPTASPVPTPTPSPKPTEPPAVPTYLTIYSKPKIFYYLGEDLDLTGLKATIYLSNGTTKIVDANELTVSEVDNTLTGVQSVYVSYGDVSNKFTVRFAGRADVRGIKLRTKPTQLSYKKGEHINLEGLTVNAIGNDGSTIVETLDVSQLSTYGYRNTEAGLVTVTVTYMDYYLTNFTVRVTNEKYVNKYTATKPSKVVYNIGETFDVDGSIVTAYYYDGTTATVDSSKLKVEGFDNTTPGVQKVNLYYNDMYVQTYSVRVI